jgi:hypothetical protein
MKKQTALERQCAAALLPIDPPTSCAEILAALRSLPQLRAAASGGLITDLTPYLSAEFMSMVNEARRPFRANPQKPASRVPIWLLLETMIAPVSEAALLVGAVTENLTIRDDGRIVVSGWPQARFFYRGTMDSRPSPHWERYKKRHGIR